MGKYGKRIERNCEIISNVDRKMSQIKQIIRKNVTGIEINR
jgi:hypothetical protein